MDVSLLRPTWNLAYVHLSSHLLNLYSLIIKNQLNKILFKIT